MKPIFLSITGYSILVAEMSNIDNMDCVNIEFNGFSGSLYSYIVIAIVIISCWSVLQQMEKTYLLFDILALTIL